MSTSIPDDVRQFIFEHVDSVAQLEVLFFLRDRDAQAFTPEQISRELRTSTESVIRRIAYMQEIGLLAEDPVASGKFAYRPKSEELRTLIGRLFDCYKVRHHKVLELIFSTVKRARQFADAFNIVKPIKSDEDDNG